MPSLIRNFILFGFLFHAGGAFLAVGIRQEHLLHGRRPGAFRQFDQLVQRVRHAMGTEAVVDAEPESVFVGRILLFMRELSPMNTCSRSQHNSSARLHIPVRYPP